MVGGAARGPSGERSELRSVCNWPTHDPAAPSRDESAARRPCQEPAPDRRTRPRGWVRRGRAAVDDEGSVLKGDSRLCGSQSSADAGRGQGAVAVVGSDRSRHDEGPPAHDTAVAECRRNPGDLGDLEARCRGVPARPGPGHRGRLGTGSQDADLLACGLVNLPYPCCTWTVTSSGR